MWPGIRDFLRVYGLVALLVGLAVWLAWGFVADPPPRRLVLAAGAPDGTYWRTAERYRTAFAREGIVLELLQTEGAVDNLARLEAGTADLAFVQGGIARPEGHAGVVAIGGIFHEAVWLFHDSRLAVKRIGELRGLRVAIGHEGSGTRALALSLLAASGVAESVATLRSLGGDAAAEALATGQVDAALFVAANPTAAIQRLLRTEGVALADFSARADAYVTAFPFLTAVRLPAGGISLSEDLPPDTTVMLAPAAQLAAREDIHPQIVALLMGILAETHARGELLTPLGSFPSALLVDFPLHPDAARWYRSGPGYLQRVAPFWVAVTIERMWVLVIPLLTVGLPLLRFAPPLWRWQGERRIYRWYQELRAVERSLAAPDNADRAGIAARLDLLDHKLARLSVPLAHTGKLYALRMHIDLVRARLRPPTG